MHRKCNLCFLPCPHPTASVLLSPAFLITALQCTCLLCTSAVTGSAQAQACPFTDCLPLVALSVVIVTVLLWQMGEPIQTKNYEYVQDYKANTCQAALAPDLFLIDSPGAVLSPIVMLFILMDGFTATCFRNKITVTILRNISLWVFFSFALCNVFKSINTGGWVTGWLKALAARPGDPNSQHLCGSSQSSLTPVPRDSVPFSGLHRHMACMWYTDIYAGKTAIRIN